MDAVQRIAQAIMQGQGNAPQQASVPQITPWDLQRLADVQKRGASPGVPGPDPMPAANTPETAPTMPPATVAASPLPPQGDAVPQMPAPDGGGLPPMPPSIAIPSTQAAPGMAQVPQTQQQLQDWMKLMDQLQFARQGQ